MDLNKEIKLSDLFRRGKGPAAEDAPKEDRPEKEKKPRKSFSFSRPPKEPRAREEKATVAPKSVPPPLEVPLMRAFNLMPKEGDREKKAGTSPALVKVALALVAFLVLAGLAGAFMLMDARVAERQSRADDLRAQLAELTAQAGPGQNQGAASLAGEGQARTAALQDALSARVAWDRILREFSLVLPDGVWLTTLSSSAAGAGATPGQPTTAAAGEGTFTISGFAESQEEVALLLSRLSVVPEFSSVLLQSSGRGADGTGEAGADQGDFSFSIVATISAQGVAS